ncbi:hypothetical protein [Amycolatopsis sp. GM8]|uniref:hypothetical protein n=1 Tax=Amycolatopsis sp. GM8 TaxID=2896530 RepID=UPI001F41F9E4|nr:hypothetical protein [Amycolatopsis sp. GM8]
MICPHCGKNLLGRERGGSYCKYCRKQFVFDPKTNKLRLHDIRLRKLAGKLSDGGKARYTTTQLWYSASRKALESPESSVSGCGCLLVVAGVASVILTVVAHIDPRILYGVLAVLVALGIYVIARQLLHRGETVIPMSKETFREEVGRKWQRVYAGLPPGLLVHEQRVAIPRPQRAELALLCADESVVACLAANGVLEARNMITAGSVEALPPDIPVVIVHDANPTGIRFADRALMELGGRPVAVAGLRPRNAMRAKGIVKLRTKERGRVTGLSHYDLHQSEQTWLGDGYWAPVAAVPPARLIAMVNRAADRLTRAERKAEQLGFLTWPAA